MAFADISVRSNLKEIQRSLGAFASKQIPFATATALTALAKRVQQDETATLSRVLKNPTPFTLKAVGMKAARKTQLTATVFVKDIAASYLAPFEFGGVHRMPGGGQTWFNPKDLALLNQYGNLPKNIIARLARRSDVFIGAVKTKDGKIINGIWQRPYTRDNQKLRGLSRRHGLVNKTTNTTGKLKLLIRFGDQLEVKQHLGYRVTAKKTINANFNAEFSTALAKAMASAR